MTCRRGFFLKRALNAFFRKRKYSYVINDFPCAGGNHLALDQDYWAGGKHFTREIPATTGKLDLRGEVDHLRATTAHIVRFGCEPGHVK